MQPTRQPRGSVASNQFCPTDNQLLQRQLLALIGQDNGLRILLQWTNCACLDQVFRKYMLIPKLQPPRNSCSLVHFALTVVQKNREQPPAWTLTRESLRVWPHRWPRLHLSLTTKHTHGRSCYCCSQPWHLRGIWAPQPPESKEAQSQTSAGRCRDCKGHVQGPELLQTLWFVSHRTHWCHHPLC